MNAKTAFEHALQVVDRGDVEALRALLIADPSLIGMHSTSVAPPYDGYFHGATLLHHVAGNPIRSPLPANIVDVARVLLESGADPEATCGGGPSQPKSGGGTVLGLVTSGAQAHQLGHTENLLDLLLEFGARLDPDGGMFGSLYHVVEYRGQREVSQMLFERGVRADLPIAAGLGNVPLMETFLTEEGRLTAGAGDIWARTVRGGKEIRPSELLNDALLAAAANGWPSAVDWLLDHGAPIDGVRSWGAFPVTALHCAGWAGWPDVVTRLLARGADATVREPTHQGTALGWASHAGNEDAVRAFRAAGVRR